jgi:hypothetical protein
MLAAAAQPAGAADGFNPIAIGIGQLQAVAALLSGASHDKIVPGSAGDFGRLAADLFAAADPKAQGPVPADGTRLRLSVSGDRTATTDASLWETATGARRDTLDVPRVGMDVSLLPRTVFGVGYSQDAQGAARLYTASLGTCVWSGSGDNSAALDFRVNYAQVTGVNHLRLTTRSVEALLSRPWGPLRAYAGAGLVDGDARLGGRFDFASQQTLSRLHAGGEATWGGARLTAEVGVTGDRTWQALRLSYGF